MKLIYDVDSKLEYQSTTKQCFIPQPRIVVVQKFDEDAYEKFLKEFSDAHNSGQDVIPILINSYGGQVYTLLGMVDIIKNSKVPVVTVLQTKAMSCGIALFTAGSQRFVSPYASLMMHEASGVSFGKVEEVEASAKEHRRVNDLLYTIMSTNCGFPKDHFKKLAREKSHADWFITAQEAKKLNIATQIGVPDLKVKIRMSYELDSGS
jgi:ATP-dependent protease ClpP protease subunit